MKNDGLIELLHGERRDHAEFTDAYAVGFNDALDVAIAAIRAHPSEAGPSDAAVSDKYYSVLQTLANGLHPEAGEPSDVAVDPTDGRTALEKVRRHIRLCAPPYPTNFGKVSIEDLRFIEAAIDRPLASKQDAGSGTDTPENRAMFEAGWDAYKKMHPAPAAPIGKRHAFTIPDGHEAVLDADDRATGETRPKRDDPSGEVEKGRQEIVGWLREIAGGDIPETISPRTAGMLADMILAAPSADPRVKALRQAAEVVVAICLEVGSASYIREDALKPLINALAALEALP